MAFQNIILFGAGGNNIGHHILNSLVEDGTFNVSVLARKSSKTTSYPDSVRVIRVSDEFIHDELVRSLQGQDVVIVTTGLAARSQQDKLIDAAIAAGVKRFIPSDFGIDNADVANQQLCPIFKFKSEVEDYLRSKETSTFSWTCVATSIWLDWALNVKFLDIDPINHTAQYWLGGTHTPSITTLPYSAKAVVQLLKHPEVGKNQRIFLSSFEASQRDIVAELEKQQGVKYATSSVECEGVVREAQSRWENQGDEMAAYRLVTAGILLPQGKSNFVSTGKKPMLEKELEMPQLTLESVIRNWILAQGQR